ncbi:MAG: MotA/TolQ/ExbB proton channel family protein [Pseudomonadota bacterium]|nr:MotA/TolQ/ExbB proton channel family protein [Pseudomonadota bacterium]
MTFLNKLIASLQNIAEVGGPVVMTLMAVSLVTLAVVIYKIWQFSAAGVGRHKALTQAITAWDAGDRPGAKAALEKSTSYLAPVVALALDAEGRDDIAVASASERLEAEAEIRFARLERGLRYLDNVAQLAPLLGLFGTVLGMIEAFQALQDAGSQVDPSVLAGGIWVALLTTAVGLVVAMPTSVALSWLEGRMDAERVIAGRAIQTVLAPMGSKPAAAAKAGGAGQPALA